MLSLANLLATLAPDLVVNGVEGITFTGVCIDSRQVQPGHLFVALRGEHTDGHAYVGAALAAGASAALVEQPVAGVVLVDTLRPGPVGPVQTPLAVRVPNTLQALQSLARAQRLSRPDLRVIGVTGSVGKTTTKEAVAAVLSEGCCTLKSTGNQNNEIGLPLTLLALQPEQRCAVLEMGMYTLGEIAALCQIAQPQVGVVTNVLPVHLERLGSLERISQAKAELVAALPEEGCAVLNGDDPWVRGMSAHIKTHSITFGLQAHNTVRADSIESTGLQGVRCVAHVQRAAWPGDLRVSAEHCALRLETLGQHMVPGALAAVAVGLWEGLDWPQIQRGLLAQGRGLRLLPRRGPNGSTLLDDTYNANPASTLAALEVLAQMPGRRLAVLGDMLELGPEEAAAHRQVGQRAAQVVHLLVTVGLRAQGIAEAAIHNGLSPSQVQVLEDNVSASAFLARVLSPGDTLLIKGSRGMAMETIVQALAEEAA